MALGFQKARRERIWLKVLLAGPSGSGKTYSALRLAKGVAKRSKGKVAAIDTENGRIRYYANEFDFDDLQLEIPYTPEKYIEAIESAIEGGYDILVIDSITHEWDYCLEVHSKMPGNSYTNWSKVTPRHDAFMEKILQSPLHVFATVRGKDEYVMEEKNGKQVPKKVGIGYKQRDNTEYNYTVTFNIDQQNHVADATKDNTHIFENRYEVLSEKDGEALYDWANSGDTPAPKPTQKSVTPTVEDTIGNIKIAIKAKVEELVSNGVLKDDISKTIKDNFTDGKGKPSANYNAITDEETANKVLEALNNINVGG
jgi:energy-coupling factor transporter ATP-binding protein EcfA2